MSSYRRLLPGVFIGSHAIAEGVLTEKQLRHRGFRRRLVHGVYADPGLPLDHQLRCRGVALLLPRGFAIGGHSVVAWHGVPFAGAFDPVVVVGPADSDWKGPRGVRVHRSQTVLDILRDPDHVPITSPLRTAWDTAALESAGTAVAALDAMVWMGAVELGSLLDLASAGTWAVGRREGPPSVRTPRSPGRVPARVPGAGRACTFRPETRTAVDVSTGGMARPGRPGVS